jgi:hypothetical protein
MQYISKFILISINHFKKNYILIKDSSFFYNTFTKETKNSIIKGTNLKTINSNRMKYFKKIYIYINDN